MNTATELIADVEKEVHEGEWKCGYCRATRRADVYGPDDVHKKIDDSIIIVIVCRACKHQDARYYAK